MDDMKQMKYCSRYKMMNLKHIYCFVVKSSIKFIGCFVCLGSFYIGFSRGKRGTILNYNNEMFTSIFFSFAVDT